jgi:hypothetical protein
MHGLGVVPTICTLDHASVKALVKGALADKAAWQRMLAIRRGYANAEPKARKEVETYCRNKDKADTALDLEVAKSLLAVQKGYMQTIQIARTANGL